MSKPSFNVLTEPWIPVFRLDGSREELGILPCLLEAHKIREIRDPSPLIEFGLYRLLVAFVLDSLILAKRRPEDHLDVRELIAHGFFEEILLRDYIKNCGDVFDMFHSTRPFMQTVLPSAKIKPLAGAYPAVPSGTNSHHWHHVGEANFNLDYPAAARLLATFAPFMTAGGAGLSPSINGAPAIYALPLGQSLFETICANLPLQKQESGTGKVAWLDTRKPGTERTQATTTEALTWRARAVQLSVDEATNSISSMKFEKGDSTRLSWIDANLGYRYDKDKVTPIRMRENKPIWREAGPLLLLSQKSSGAGEDKVVYQRPDVINTAFKSSSLQHPVRIVAYGMRTDMKMKVFEWVRTTFEVPVKLGQSTRLGAIVQLELDLAEKMASALSSSVKQLYPREGAGNKAALGNLADRCERAYWQHLENQFQPLMAAFAEIDENAPDNPTLIAETATRWRDAIKRIAIQQFEIAAQDMDADSDALERQVKARIKLRSSLKKHLS
jgi:CRISPR system Cascade subunit CasA